MEDYVKELLAAGFFRPSSSPVGAGFFFCTQEYPLPLTDTAFLISPTSQDIYKARSLERITSGSVSGEGMNG